MMRPAKKLTSTLLPGKIESGIGGQVTPSSLFPLDLGYLLDELEHNVGRALGEAISYPFVDNLDLIFRDPVKLRVRNLNNLHRYSVIESKLAIFRHQFRRFLSAFPLELSDRRLLLRWLLRSLEKLLTQPELVGRSQGVQDAPFRLGPEKLPLVPLNLALGLLEFRLRRLEFGGSAFQVRFGYLKLGIYGLKLRIRHEEVLVFSLQFRLVDLE